jgi:uncharacterized protein YbjQ (UPF0145 family)
MLGRKAIEQGANAVIGFKQFFDLENENKSIVGRAIGTACTIANSKLGEKTIPRCKDETEKENGTPNDIAIEEANETQSSNELGPHKLPTSAVVSSHPRVYDSESIGTGSSAQLPQYVQPSLVNPSLHGLQGTKKRVRRIPPLLSVQNAANGTSQHRSGTWMEQPVQLLTLTRYPGNSVVRVAGLVSAKSVKLLGNEDTPHVREQWWMELRDEIKSHAKALHCGYVLGYQETTAIHDDLIVLCAMGTAGDLWLDNTLPCRFAHVPYTKLATPFPMTFAACQGCFKRHVPQILMSTLDPPAHLDLGPGILIEAHLCRPKKRKDGETNAANVSDAIPFTEYDLHKQLMSRLKQSGFNSIFGIRMQLSMGDEFLIAVASGTAFYLPFLPTELATQQGEESVEARKRTIAKDDGSSDSEDSVLSSPSLLPTSTGEISTSIIDFENDSEDVEHDIHAFTHMYTTTPGSTWIPSTAEISDQGFRHQLLVVVKQGTLNPKAGDANRQLSILFRKLYTQVSFRLAFLSSCVLAGISYEVDVVSPNQVQIRWYAVAMGNVGFPTTWDIDRWLQDGGDPVSFSAIGSGSATQDSTDISPNRPNSQENHSFVVPNLSPTSRGQGDDGGNRSSAQLSETQVEAIQRAIDEDLVFEMEEDVPGSSTRNGFSARINKLRGIVRNSDQGSSTCVPPLLEAASILSPSVVAPLPTPLPDMHVEISSLPVIPHSTMIHYLGQISLHFVKESSVTPGQEGEVAGMGFFVQCKWTEMLAVVVAHVQALGGNALVAFRVDHSGFHESIKNQAYSLVSISGDVCIIEKGKSGVPQDEPLDEPPSNEEPIPLGT